jgi:thiamine-phosphate pyrophosphorylase
MRYILRGLYIITDKNLIPRGMFLETVEKALRGGARILQLREKDSSQEEIMGLGKGLLQITRKYDVPLIINDSPFLAKKIGADGVHLGKDDPSIQEARKILGSEAIIGASCYGEIERGIQAEKEGADYVAFGTPFFTPTKPERKGTPLEVLRDARKRITKIPIFAIGGINKENAPSVLETGVDGIAVITGVFGSPDPERAARDLASLF